MSAIVTVDQVQQLFAAYLNESTTVAKDFVDFCFGLGDRSITGDITVTGNVITNEIKQRTSAGLKIGAGADKIGFYDVSPVVRQVLATGAAHTVDDVITFLQLIGACKQA